MKLTKRKDFKLRQCAVVFSVMVAIAGSPPGVTAGTFLGYSSSVDWTFGQERAHRMSSEIAAELQPSIRDVSASESPVGLEFRYDGRSFGNSSPYSHNLDFDLPVDAFERSTTYTFGTALFKMDLPCLAFNRSAATYTFKDTWRSAALGAGLADGAAIKMTAVDAAFEAEDFPGPPSRAHLYGIDGTRLTHDSWDEGGVSQMLSAVVMGYDLDADVKPAGMTPAFGSISTLDLDSQAGEHDMGLIGILAMLALGGAALFITLEINRDKFDNYR